MASSSVRSGSSASAAPNPADTASVPCTTCRKRRVKCDKRLPGCTRCEKSGQPCPGYNRLRSFLDQGEALRQKYSGPSPKIKPQREGRSPLIVPQPDLKPQPRIKQQHDGLSVSPFVPLHFPQASSQTAQPTTSATGHFVPSDLDPVPSGTGTHQDTLSSYMSLDTLSDDEFNATFFDIDPNIYFAEGNNCCGWIPNAPLLNDLPDSQAPTISWLNQITPGNFSDSSPYPETSIASMIDSDSPSIDVASGDEYETAHLIQHFSEHISPYLDVFDIEKYFGHVVPVRARRSNLLSSSLAAIAAKQFAKTKKEPLSGQSAATTPSGSFLDQYYTDPNVDWFYKAASFYDKAIVQMMSSLQSLRDGCLDTGLDQDSGLDTASPPFQEDTPMGQGGKTGSRTKRQRTDRARTPANVLDDLLAAVSIFLLYESLDNRQLEINQHMSGAQHLLMENLPDPASAPTDPRIRTPLRSFDTVQAWQASFWNVVRIDYVVSYVERGHPRLGTEDQRLWQAAGLPLRDLNGVRLPESLCVSKDSSFSPRMAPMSETAACRTLLWIVLKALSFAAEQRDQSRTMEFMPHTEATAAAKKQQPLDDVKNWQAIRDHLQAWNASLPDSFEPYLRLAQHRPSQAQTPNRSDHSAAGGDSAAIAIQFPTLQYSSAMASTAMVLYHFIQIFLLLHRPLSPSNQDTFSHFASQRLGAYRQVSREVDDHANRICGICLGRPDDAVRMHMVQPLHLAGLSLEGQEQRVILEGLLSGIRKGTGCSTEWIVTSLRGEWGWKEVVPY